MANLDVSANRGAKTLDTQVCRLQATLVYAAAPQKRVNRKHKLHIISMDLSLKPCLNTANYFWTGLDWT